MVPRADLAAAVNLNSMGFNMTRSVGPAIGGVIVALAGAAAAFAVNTVSYFALIYTLWRWHPVVPSSNLPRERLGSAIFAGLRYVAMSPNLEKVMLRGFVFGVSASSILALLPVVALDLVAGGPLTYGLMLGSFGIGAIGGAVLNARLREKFSSETIIRCAFAGFAFATAVCAVSTYALLTCAILFVAGACWVLALSLFNTIVQLSTPRWVVGRALSLYQTVTFGGIAVGSWLWGVAADRYGVSHALLFSAVVMLFGIIVGFRLSMPAFASLNLDPLNRFTEPALALEITPRSGPIAIQVEYRIAEIDLQEFMVLMAERRRVRLRDGAKHWSLLRDLAEPSLWTESFHTPTWVEYLRHNQRRTQADAENADRLRALHQGDDNPIVRRKIERQAIPPRDDVLHKAPIDLHH
jgi:MFS family permease